MKLNTLLHVAAAVTLTVSCSKNSGTSALADDGNANITSAIKNKYVCSVETGRQQGQTLPSEGELQFMYQSDASTANISDLIGFISTNYDFNVEANGTDKEIANYTGVFKGDFKNQDNYKPTTYTNHVKFANFDAVVTSKTDGGGMFGYLVVSKDNGQDKIDAHYVFQAGDHIGGTIDLNCKKK